VRLTLMNAKTNGFLATVALIAVTASPALAGTVTLVNTSTKHYCNATATVYVLGIPFDVTTPCVAPGSSGTVTSWLSTGYIRTECPDNALCRHFCGMYNERFAMPCPGKKYDVPGTWLPHRNFTVTFTPPNDFVMIEK